MSESSRSGFTVTLGRSGRVGTKVGELSEERYGYEHPMSGGKRSIRDRLGRNSDDRHHPYSKRQRGEGFGTSSSNDTLRKDDLRFKLMKKNTVRQSDSLGNVDLRDKLLSRKSRSSVDSKAMRPPESTVSTRHQLTEPRYTGVTRHLMPEPRGTSILGRYPSSRNPSELSIMEPTQPSRPYTSWTLDNLRRKSPERLYQSSSHRGISPERSREDLQKRTIRAYDDGRSSSCMRISPPRLVSSSPFLTRSSVPVGPGKSAAPLPPHYPQASGIVHKIPSMGDEPLTVEGLLQYLGLEKYSICFKAEEIDMKTLKQLGDTDLKDLGIPMGPRKKIIQFLMPRVRRLP